jgi:Mce-associated membrane protein
MTVAGGAQVETPDAWSPVQLGRPGPPYAAWGRRVIASLLDGMLGSGVAFLALDAPELALPFLGVSFGTRGNHDPGLTTWTDSGWAVGTVLAAVVMQAYLGATPGKLAMGLTVVRVADARPVGLLRTVGRWLLHILDAIFLIGFLRPLWNADRQTFADSLMSTVVLQTRRPRAHRWFASPDSSFDPGPPVSWEAPSAPSWLPIATTLSVLACAAGALFSLPFGSSRSTTQRLDLTCLMTSTDPGPFGLTGGTVTADVGDSTQTRLGVTRRSTAGGQAPVATWQLSATSDAPVDGTLRVSFTSADGAATRTYDFPTLGGVVGTTSASWTLPVDAVVDLGSSWRWSQSVVVDGVESPACIGSITLG